VVPNGLPCAAADVAVDPQNPFKVYAAIHGHNVYRSTDGGDTWTTMTFPGITAGIMGRQTLAVSPSSRGTLYAMIAAPNGIQFSGFFRSTDSGDSWAAATAPEVKFGAQFIDGTNATAYALSNFAQTIAVDPGNPSTLFFGGVGPYLSTTGATTPWTFLGGSVGGTAQVTHADQHAAAFDPFANIVYVGNDGGFYSYNLDNGAWSQLNFALSAGAIQGIGPHPFDNTMLLSGFQDNGTQLYSGSQGWQQADSGDGGFALFDQADPHFAYHTFAVSY
jgi:hypothetical protein